MMPGVLYRKLRSLNPRIRIYVADGSAIAGVYVISPDRCELEHVCGVDANDVPEHVEYNLDGTHRKGGWRRVLKSLIQKGYIDRWAAQRVFNTYLEYRTPRRSYEKPKIKSREEMTDRANEIVAKYK